jgi:hypothetical protein
VPDCRLFGVLTKADRIEKPEVALQECKEKFGDLRFEQYFITSALARQGVEAPFTAAADTTGRGAISSVMKQGAAEKGNGCC